MKLLFIVAYENNLLIKQPTVLSINLFLLNDQN